MRINRKLWIVMTVVVVLIALATIQIVFFSNTSTHHFSISISLPEGDANMDRRIADFDKIIGLLDAWAPTAGFVKVSPDAPASTLQSWFSSTANGNEKTVYFTEQSPKNPSFPMEIMAYFDPDGSPKVEIMTAAGYSKYPTPKFKKLHADLQKLLTDNFPDRIKAKLW